MSEAALLRKFRLPRQEILQLLNLVGPTLARQTRRSYPLSPEIQLLAALHFYAVGSFLEVVGDGYGLSKTSVWRCVEAVTNCLLGHAKDYIHLPSTRQEIMEVHQGFHAIADIPRVIGLVDGTLIPIANPSVLDQAFISRDNSGWADLFGRTQQNAGPLEVGLLEECFLQEYPESCYCIQTEVDCVEVNLSSVPRLSPNVTLLSLKSNTIHVLPDYVFSEYSSMERLFLQNNGLHTISKHAFSGLHNLKKLVLDHNPLRSVSQDTFTGLQSLMFLDLVENQIQVLNYSILKTCSKLEVL
ncbi:hypothetical protein NHX12_010086 [Muraenolepis orangiensis]|uniref:Uncharacterized protein n=1 Tax=Muraenolepis orangiensis TaxID=630683 RepID=A0A9Q0I8J5_9TELE|nr:hypothetical protein NHX12_010086 [Muraenolepis orangiensis]